MKWLDRYLRDVRIRQALPFVHRGDRLLDVGCFDQTLLRRCAPRVSLAVGIDPLAEPLCDGAIRMIRGTFGDENSPVESEFGQKSFDCITMLAVLEHVPRTDSIAAACERLLRPGGRVIVTVPRVEADHVLAFLRALRLIHGMSLEEHHGYDVRRTAPIFEAAGLATTLHRRFELGLNNLFVFEKPVRGPQVTVRTMGGAEPVPTARGASA